MQIDTERRVEIQGPVSSTGREAPKLRFVESSPEEKDPPVNAAGEISGDSAKTVYETLKEEILRLDIKPGEPVSESDVCGRFSVSRTPVRMAFQRLKDAGLLSVIPYKNTTASLLSFRQVEQSIYLRIAVESMVLRDMIAGMDAVAEEKIRHALRLQEILLSGDFTPEEFYQNDSALHRVWFRFTGKNELWKMIQRLHVNYTRFRMLDIVEVRNFRQIFEEHQELFRIIRDRNAGQVEDFMRRHLYGGINRLGERINTEFASYFINENENEPGTSAEYSA